MKKSLLKWNRLYVFIVSFALVIMLSLWVENKEAKAWGFYAHKRINRLAVFTLPNELIAFYKRHIEFVTEHAVDPDKRRYAVDGEAPKHYIDIDHFSKDAPFKVMPRSWTRAVEKFGRDTIETYGTLPWNITLVHANLTKAFRDKNVFNILRYSADIGHYIGDAHVPLHTTENYNGHMTNQKGIHAFWESRLPELNAEDYDYFVGKAHYISNPLDFIWDRIEESHNALDSVLKFEQSLNDSFPADQKYSFEKRGLNTLRTYSKEYSMAYHEMLDGQVERRMKAAVLSIGCFWYTAWVNAGMPQLEEMQSTTIEDFEIEMAKEAAKWKNKTIKSRSHEH